MGGGGGRGEKGSELALVLATARRNVFSKNPITRFDKQPSMHMSMPACAHAQVCPCSPTATAISSSHLITKLPFQREVNSRLPKSHSSSRDTDLLSKFPVLGATSHVPGSCVPTMWA